MDREALKSELIRDEGMRLKPYRDTVGKLTIGVGRNLDDNGISRGEALYLLERDIDTALALLKNEPWWPSVADDEVRSRVMVNMTFNLGINRLRGFPKLLRAVHAKQWVNAAVEMRDSKWADQVGDRAERLAKMMETGRT